MLHPKTYRFLHPRRRRNENPPTFFQITLPPLKLLLVQLEKPRLRLGAIHTPSSAEPSLEAARPLPRAAPSGPSHRGRGWCAAPRRPRVEGEVRRERAVGGAGRGDSAEPGPPLAPTPGAHSARPPARPRPPGSSSSPALRSPARRPPPAPVRLPPALAPSPPAPAPAALRPGKPPTRPGVPLALAGLPAPAPGPQPYLGKIFSCRRRRQEGLSVAPSINSHRLGLPPGLGSPGLGVRSPALASAPLGSRGPRRGALVSGPRRRVRKRRKEPCSRRAAPGPGSCRSGRPRHSPPAARSTPAPRGSEPAGPLLGTGARPSAARGVALLRLPGVWGWEWGVRAPWTRNRGSGCAYWWQEKFPKLREMTRFKAPRYAHFVPR